MKHLIFITSFLCIITLFSCGDDGNSTPSTLGKLEGTTWKLTVLDMEPEYSVSEEYWYSENFMDYANHIGLPYEELSMQNYVVKEKKTNKSTKTYTLSFAKNACQVTVDAQKTYKVNEVTYTYNCYRFTPQDFIVPNQRFSDIMDTIRVTNDNITYHLNKQFTSGTSFDVPLQNGVFRQLFAKSTLVLPDEQSNDTQKATFSNIRVDNTTFIMQNGDNIYSAQYDVSAGWLILKMISPESKEIGKFTLKKY